SEESCEEKAERSEEDPRGAGSEGSGTLRKRTKTFDDRSRPLLEVLEGMGRLQASPRFVALRSPEKQKDALGASNPGDAPNSRLACPGNRDRCPARRALESLTEKTPRMGSGAENLSCARGETRDRSKSRARSDGRSRGGREAGHFRHHRR